MIGLTCSNPKCNYTGSDFIGVTGISSTEYQCTKCGWVLLTNKSNFKDVAQQPHYTQWKIQPITFITANKLNFCQGNVIKYVMRYKEKNGLEDLKKAKVYIDYLIQELETGEVKP
jgi:hypothetical protein